MTLFAVLYGFLLTTGFGSQDFIGFSPTNQFFLEPHSGNVLVICSDYRTTMSKRWDCEDWFFNHDEQEYFYHSNKQANRFSLVAYHSDGSKTEKSGDFDPSKGHSARRVNLWISTLLQKPLLKEGYNRVSFTLFDKEKVLDTGEFNVSVTESNKKRYKCPGGIIQNRGTNDCYFPERACRDYFYSYLSRCKPDGK